MSRRNVEKIRGSANDFASFFSAVQGIPVLLHTIPMPNLILFLIGGGLYVLLEFFWRGRSHISMFLAGGGALMLMGGVYRFFPDWPALFLCLYGALLITAIEFVVGAVVNVRMNLGVWDYSHMRFQLYGQICLRYSLLWFLLSAPAVAIIMLVYDLTT